MPGDLLSLSCPELVSWFDSAPGLAAGIARRSAFSEGLRLS